MLANNLRRGKSFGVAIIINVILLVLAQSLTSAAGSQSTTRRGGTIPPVHLPLSNHADSTSPNQDRWYAMVYHAGDFTGVHGTIEVADPVRRYNGAGNSGVKIATIFPGGGWIEAGWTKQSLWPSGNQCNPVHYWAVDPGYPVYVSAATITADYRYTIAMSDQTRGFWLVRIVDNFTNYLIFEKTDILTGNSTLLGTQIQAFGEVGPAPIQDMGVSGLLSLKFRKQLGTNWQLWSPPGRYQNPPYTIVGLWGTWNANFQVYGQQGTPGFYCQ